jgi:LmeA-like phospholipid-binding
MTDQPGLEEQAISEVLKRGLESQLDEVEAIDVQVKTDLIKIVQGKADSVTVEGQGLVIQEDIRVQEIELQIDEVSINPFSVLLGDIELNQPVDTTARIVLTEADLNRAINSDYVQSKLPKLELNVEGKTVAIELLLPLKIQLPSAGKIHPSGNARITESTKTQEIAFSAVLSPSTETQPILLEAFCCAPGQGQSLPLLIALLQKLQEIVNQPYFELEETIFQVKSIEIEPGSLTAQVEIHAHQIPSL